MVCKIGFVYKITSPSKRIYIGSTDYPKRRIAQYENSPSRYQIKIYRSIKKHGWKSHKFEIIWCGDFGKMLNKEAEYGNIYDVLNSENLNLRLPKLNESTSCFSDETKKKMSNSAKKKFENNPELKKNIAKAAILHHTGKLVSLETRKKMSEWQIGRKMSNEAKHKMRKAKLGKPAHENTKKRAKEFHSIPICQYDLNNKFIKEWTSAQQAKDEDGFNAGHIRSCCRGERKTHKKFKWKNKY